MIVTTGLCIVQILLILFKPRTTKACCSLIADTSESSDFKALTHANPGLDTRPGPGRTRRRQRPCPGEVAPPPRVALGSMQRVTVWFSSLRTWVASEPRSPPRKMREAPAVGGDGLQAARGLLAEAFHSSAETSGLQGVRTHISNHVRVSTRPQGQCYPSDQDLPCWMGAAIEFLHVPLLFHIHLHVRGPHTTPKHEAVMATTARPRSEPLTSGKSSGSIQMMLRSGLSVLSRATCFRVSRNS